MKITEPISRIIVRELAVLPFQKLALLVRQADHKNWRTQRQKFSGKDLTIFIG
jgi:hypothetical protein